MNFVSHLLGSTIPNLDATSAKEKLNTNSKPFLLDVRQPEEYREGHIAGATLIPLGELQQRMKELPRDRQIICVCRSGNRSSSATRFLVSAGYDAINLRGGMIDWANRGLAIKKGMNA